MKKIVLISVILISSLFSDGFEFFNRKKDVDNVQNALYQKVCSECHFAYQAGWLPKRSWEKIMSLKELENHFGDNAEMDEQDRILTLKFLIENSAETSSYKRSKKILASIKDSETPLRIIETRYMKRKHDEIPQKLIKQKEVISLSHCQKCHTKADKGSYSDDEIIIPNYGKWEN